jgi:hypothetical protein
MRSHISSASFAQTADSLELFQIEAGLEENAVLFLVGAVLGVICDAGLALILASMFTQWGAVDRRVHWCCKYDVPRPDDPLQSE